MIALSPNELATVNGGDLEKTTKAINWWGNVLQKGVNTGLDMSEKGSYIGAGMGLAGSVMTGPAAIATAVPATLGGMWTGAKVGLGVGFLWGAGAEAIRTWND
jgi:hypothetical protein